MKQHKVVVMSTMLEEMIDAYLFRGYTIYTIVERPTEDFRPLQYIIIYSTN
jgi:hypothetical protein